MREILIPTDRPFEGFGKITRASKGSACVITEKIDGTNAQIVIENNEIVAVGSRKRWIQPGKDTDNYGFARWVEENYDNLLKLGEGTHFGEWYGSGINRGYGLSGGQKHFALFNADRWYKIRPSCCDVVPILFRGAFSKERLRLVMDNLWATGSQVVPSFDKPEGVIVWLYGQRVFLKATFDFPDGKWVTK